ncbi:hypothetical protein MHU86_19224 [Fragilaria crotonensis]|nr:hypothetical protein MHU86_19224 [Fragilaria crotonensis]
MKRQQNALHWPYIAMVVLDGDKKIFVACESISCAERIETYAWICDFVFTHAPRRPRKDVNMIFSDCFVTDSLLQSLGIQTTCHIGWDAYHLLREDWPSYFGNALWPLVVDSMKKMLFGNSEAEYQEGYTSAIASMRNHESKYTEYIQKWHRNRGKFAKHIVSHRPGSLRRHGSSHAEQNHASFVQRIGPVCLDDPATAISTILRRHADISSERNHEITRYHLSVASRVQAKNLDTTDVKAINFLSSWGFKLWQEMRIEARNYQVEYVSSQTTHITRIGVCAAEPRILSTSGTMHCNCCHKVALQIQCPHETALANGDFLSHLWNKKRWQQRSKLMLSYPLVQHEDNIAQHGEEVEIEELPGPIAMMETQNVDSIDEMPMPADSQQENSFMQQRLTTVDSRVDAIVVNDSTEVLQSQLHDHVRLPQQGEGTAQQTSITFAMLKRVACELVEVAMKQNNESKKVTVCGMMLRATNLLKGNGLLGGAGFEEAVEQYLHSFSAHNPNLFSGREVSADEDVVVQAPADVRCSGRPSTNRLQSRTEIFRRPRNGAPKQRSCGFCFEDGHTVNQCVLMGQQGKQVLHAKKDQFCYGILDTFAVKQLNHRQHPTPTVLSHLIGATHIAIVGLHVASRNASTTVVNKKSRTREIGVQQVIAKVTLLGEGGNPLAGDSHSSENEFYTLTSVLSWIAKSSCKKRVFYNLTQLSETDDFEYQYT